MIETWSSNDLRCKVQERETQGIKDLEWDRPNISREKGGFIGASIGRKVMDRPRSRWPIAVIGALIIASGALWLLTILGFEVPWYSVIPLGLMMIGTFIIASALNLRTGFPGTSYDRCDH
jgi:hypothetical protein